MRKALIVALGLLAMLLGSSAPAQAPGSIVTPPAQAKHARKPTHPVLKPHAAKLSEREQMYAAAIESLCYSKGWADLWSVPSAPRYMSLDGKDPSRVLLNRFASRKPLLLPGSKFKERATRMFELEDGKHGLRCELSKPERAGPRKATMYFFRCLGRYHGLGGKLVLKKANGVWKVVGADNHFDIA